MKCPCCGEARHELFLSFGPSEPPYKSTMWNCRACGHWWEEVHDDRR